MNNFSIPLKIKHYKNDNPLFKALMVPFGWISENQWNAMGVFLTASYIKDNVCFH